MHNPIISSKQLRQELSERILVLDGALGTQIQKTNIPDSAFASFEGKNTVNLKSCNDLLNLCAPESIEKIHLSYLEAGADIIETNTFNANAVSLKEYSLENYVTEINKAGVEIAREAIRKSGRNAWIAGSIGPTNISLSILQSNGDLTSQSKSERDILEDAYYEQITALIEAGADIILIETVFDTLNAKTAISALIRAREKTGVDIPVMISATLTENGRTLSGQTIEAFVISVSHCNPISIGVNCGFGAEALLPFIDRIQDIPFAISVYPNAGLPNPAGEYDESAETMLSKLLPAIKEKKINIVGGCCGTTPKHIRALSEAVNGIPPRKIPEADDKLRLAGLEALTIGNRFVKVGERCNVAGSRKFLRLIKERNFSEAIKIAEEQVKAGAEILDINMDDPLLNPCKDMTEFISLISSETEIARIPFMIDTSEWEVAKEALKRIQGKPVVNSISLKEGENEFIRKAKYIHSAGAAMVVMAFDEISQADTFERKVEICKRAYNLLISAGIPTQDIIFDPNILAIATGIDSHRNYGVDFIKATKWIKENLRGVHISGGLSNLSFSFRGNNPVREAMHIVFLEEAIPAGMDMAIINPAAKTSSAGMDEKLHEAVENVVMNLTEDATERLIEISEEMKNNQLKKEYVSAEKNIQKPEKADEKLQLSIIKGRQEGLEDLLTECLDEYGSALNIIDGPLMSGMNEVGRLFGEGLMFLPQVVKSAQTMQKAVEILTPRIESEKAESDKRKAGKMIIATVKGDVHDIGKNIVAIIMRCNGFDVTDLGVMVEKETIISKAIEEKADFIGLSGLITPSLAEMGNVATAMENSGLKIPLFVGGAAASELHTALRIAPLYSGNVVYTKDAASLPGVVQKFLSDSTKEEAEESLKNLQESLRDSYKNKTKFLSPEQARLKRRPFNSSSKVPKPEYPGEHTFEISISEIRELINWRSFFGVWKLDAEFASIAEVKGCDHCKAQWLASIPEKSRCKGSEAMQLFKEANRLLDLWEKRNFYLTGRLALQKVHSEGDDLIVEADNSDETIRIPLLRQHTATDMDFCLSLSDYFDTENDNTGFFVVTIGGMINNFIKEAEKESDTFYSLLAQSVADRLVEAAAEWLHRKTARELWGYAKDKENNGQHVGIRPAVGYPSLPDQSLIFIFDKILKYSDLGIEITENGALSPSSTVSGMILGNRDARYFSIGDISEEMRLDYSKRRGMELETINKFLPK